MKYTTVAVDAFQKFQLNAGIILTEFDPANPPTTAAEIAAMREKIFIATSDGVTFTVTPEFTDLAEDIDNLPDNTKEFKVLQSVSAVMSGTGKTVDTVTAKRLMAAADIQSGGKIVPRADLKSSDFFDLWYVGDYSAVNVDSTGTAVDGKAGFVAIKLMNALSTGGFSLKSNDKGKSDFAFEFTGHYSVEDMTVLPYLVWISEGTESSDVSYNSALSSLTISDATLDPTFAAETTEYAATTTAATATVTATAAGESAGATVVITVNGNSIANGGTATWAEGENELEVTVTNHTATTTYTVTVTYTAGE